MKSLKSKKQPEFSRFSKISDKEIEQSIKTIIGEDTIPILSLLKKRKNISEFKIAEKLNLPINTIRNIIYKMDTYNLLSSTRKKDKKKGWYIYYWTFHPEKAKSFIFLIKQKKLKRLKEELKKEQGNIFFICHDECTKLNIEDAMEIQYKCPECGKLMQQEDTQKKIKNLKKEVEDLEKEIFELN